MSRLLRRLLRTALSAGLVLPGLALLPGSVPGGAVAAFAAAPDGREVGFAQSHRILWESDADLAADLDAMKAAGATWVRVDFDWPSIQPRSSTRWNWAPTDRVVNAARARGLQVLAMPAYTPAWARASGTNGKYPPTNPDHYAAFVRAAVNRYKSLGVKHWEIWNEPNSYKFWAPKPSVVAYTTLLKKAATAIRSADASAVVITAGLSPASDAADGTMVAPATFLRGIYDNGGQSSFDAVGHHPYSFPYEPMTAASWNAFYQTLDLSSLMQSKGDGAKKIWATEVGFPTGTVSGRSVDEATQATRVRQLTSAWFDWSFHGPMFWFSLRDFSTNQADHAHMFGLLRYDFSQKPGYAALVQSLKAPQRVVASPGDGSVGVSWTAPGYDYGSAITAYTVVASPGGATVSVAGTARSATVPVANGAAYTFTVQPVHGSVAGVVSSPSNAVVPGVPTLVPGSVSSVEGRLGTVTPLLVPVYLTNAYPQPVTVQYATLRVAPLFVASTSDIDDVSGTLTFQPGETVKYVSVNVKGDNNVEPDDRFLLAFSNATNANVGGFAGLGGGTILNDD